MNKELFEKIVGTGFSTTNYKVESLEDLKAVFQKQVLDLNKRVYIQNSDIYNLKPSEKSPDNIGTLDLIEQIALGDIYDCSISQLDSYHKYIMDALKFRFSNEDRTVFFKDEFLRLEKSFLKNPYSKLLSPENYFNEINSYEFITGFWLILKNNNLQAFLDWKKNPQQIIDDILISDDENEDSIYTLILSLGQFTTLKFIYDEFSEQKDPNKNSDLSQINLYPAVFTCFYGYKLFNYLIETYQKTIGPAFLTQYFLLFITNKLILKSATLGDYNFFLKQEHDLKLKEFDRRTPYNYKHEEYAENLEKNFYDIYGLTNPFSTS